MMKFNIPIEIEPQMVADLITTALEGGSNYWYLTRGSSDFKVEQTKHLTYFEALAENLDKGYDFNVPIYDLEDEHELLGYLSPETIKQGLRLFAQDHTEAFVEWATSENYDAGVADTAFQLMVLGEVTY
jgi:hypothetical protein